LVTPGRYFNIYLGEAGQVLDAKIAVTVRGEDELNVEVLQVRHSTRHEQQLVPGFSKKKEKIYPHVTEITWKSFKLITCMHAIIRLTVIITVN
jgi:hypothetical protein